MADERDLQSAPEDNSAELAELRNQLAFKIAGVPRITRPVAKSSPPVTPRSRPIRVALATTARNQLAHEADFDKLLLELWPLEPTEQRLQARLEKMDNFQQRFRLGCFEALRRGVGKRLHREARAHAKCKTTAGVSGSLSQQAAVST